MKYYRIVCLIFLLSLLCEIGYCQDVYYEQFTDADGLPSMTIYEMIQDSNGVLWLGTENGLVSYDGESFQTYTHPDLQDNDIIQLELCKDGDILFTNLSHQLSKIVDGQVQIIFTGKGSYYYLFSSKDDDYVLEKDEFSKIPCYNVYKLLNNKLVLFTVIHTEIDESKKRNGILSSNHPENRIYYLLENDSVLLLKNKNRQEYEDFDTSIFTEFSFENKNYNSDNQFFMASSNDRGLVLLPNMEAFYVVNNFIENYDALDIQRIIIQDDKYYVVLQNSLEIYDPSNSQKKLLLDNIIVNTVFKDRENNVWVSTRENGLLKIPNINLNIKSFDDYEQIISGVYANDNRILLSWGDKLELRNEDNQKILDFDLESDKKTIVKVHENSFIISSWHFYVTIDISNIIGKTHILRGPSKALEFRNTKFYSGTNGHLYVFPFSHSPKGIIFDKEINQIELKNIYALKFSEKQNLFLAGTTNGLYQIDENDNVSKYMQELSSSNIIDIVETRDSSFWIATKNEGIYIIKEGEVIHHFDTTNGLLTNNINDLDVQDEFVYAASTNGLIQINMNTLSVINKNSNSGLPSDNITNLAIFNDSIWIAIQKDIVVVDSTFFTTKNVSSTISLDRFYCNNKLIDYNEGLNFSYDKNKIEISFKNVSLNSGSNKSLKYRIQNLDPEWVYSKESVIRLPSLQPAKYHIEAIGVNAEGIESKPLHLSFEIKPAWWETTWARIISVLLMVGIVGIIMQIRGRRIRKEETLKRDYLHQINKIKDQALQLQMNPHFIFNSLNAIQGFIGTDEEEMAMNYLARFARLIRLIFEHSKGNTITLEEELEFINLYLDLEKLRFKDKVNIEITIDPEVENAKDIINVPPLLIQPIIENSFKHGLFHKKGKGNLSVKYTLQNEILQVTIQDNGIGRIESKKISRHNSEKQTSSGIKTTLERIDLLNFGKDKKLNRLEIEDLYDDEGNAEGTKTKLYLSI